MSEPAASKPVLWARSFVPAWAPLAYAFVLLVLAGMLGKARELEQQAIAIVLVALGLALVYLAARRRKAEVGSEAIRIRWPFYQRMLRYADVRRATPEGRKRVVLTTMDGETLELTVGYFDAAVPRDVIERLWTAIAAGAEEGSRGTEREMLARSGRTTETWRAALRELGSPGSYRRSTIAPDRLWAIAENPGIESEVRAGALVALSASKPDEAMRDRFQRIGATTVDPSLQALLNDLANGQDDRALDAVRDEAR